MNPMRGIGLKVLSVAVFMAMATCIKAAAPHVPPGEAVFFRSLFAIPVILIWLIWQHNLAHGLATSNPLGHVWRGLLGGTSMLFGFTALGLLPLPEVTAIGYASPLLTVIFGAMFLGEEVRAFRISAVLLGMVGVIIVISPRLTLASLESASQWEMIGVMAILMGSILGALAQVFVRKLVQSESTATIVFYFSLNATVLSLFTIPFGWVMPETKELVILIAAGLLGGIGQILLTQSYRHAPTSVIAPFEYVSMLMALGVGYFLFDEVPTSRMMIGALIVMLAGLLIIWRERQLGLERGKARSAMTPQG